MSKIVVMDSGFGGLTVLSELRKLMPDEEYIFYGDSANAPYGEKTHDELRKCTFAICRELSSKYDIKCFIIACNTTSSEVWEELTAEFGAYDFIGIEPALKQAADENQGKNILVLATTATTKGKRLQKRYEELKEKANITLLPAPGIVPYVENLKKEKAEFRAYLAELLKDYRGKTDCVVLGCTHFPFVKEELWEALGDAVLFYDAAANVAEACKALVEAKNDADLSLVLDKNVPVHIHEGSRQSGKESKNNEKNGSDIIFLNSDPDKVALEEELLRMYAAM